MAIRYLFKGDIDRAPMYKAEANRLLFQLNLIGNPVGALSSVMRDGTIVQVKKVFGQAVATINAPPSSRQTIGERRELGWYVSAYYTDPDTGGTSLKYFSLTDLRRGRVNPIDSIAEATLLAKENNILVSITTSVTEGESVTETITTYTLSADGAELATAENTQVDTYAYSEEMMMDVIVQSETIGTTFLSVYEDGYRSRFTLADIYALLDPELSQTWYQTSKEYTYFNSVGVVVTEGVSFKTGWTDFQARIGVYEGLGLNKIEYYDEDTWVEVFWNALTSSAYTQRFRGKDRGALFDFEIAEGLIRLVQGAHYVARRA